MWELTKGVIICLGSFDAVPENADEVCFMVEDNRGPYASEAECLKREDVVMFAGVEGVQMYTVSPLTTFESGCRQQGEPL